MRSRRLPLLLPHSPSDLRELLLSLGPAAPAIALAAWMVLTPALFPGTVLAAAGGLAFGALGGGRWPSSAPSPAAWRPSGSPVRRPGARPSA